MKYYFISCLFVLLSCNKDKKNSDYTPSTILSIKDVVNNSIGNYSCTRICKSGSNISGYVSDTAYNITLSVFKENDTVLFINGYTLSFSGNLDIRYYHFYQPASGGGHHAIFDTLFKQISFSYWNGGLGGGSGCSYSGIR